MSNLVPLDELFGAAVREKKEGHPKLELGDGYGES